MTTLETVQSFLGLVFEGKMDAALELVSDDAAFTAVRPDAGSTVPLYGAYAGKSGAERMFSGFGEHLEPGEFEILGSFEQGEQAALYGRFNHSVRKNGAKFPSNWALIAKTEAGKLSYYHFYEDSEALAEAFKA